MSPSPAVSPGDVLRSLWAVVRDELRATTKMGAPVGNYTAARALADRAALMAPDAGVFRGTRCLALAGLGDGQQARAECARAVAVLPENLFFIGVLALLDHRYEEAREAWRRASDDPSAARELAAWVARLPAKG